MSKRILHFMVIGVALSFLTACTMGGSEGDCAGPTSVHSKSAGWGRGYAPESTGVSLIVPGGWIGHLHGMKWDKFIRNVQFGPQQIRNYDLFKPSTGCAWDEQACRGYIVKADAPTGGRSVLKMIAADTNGDGKISVGIGPSPGCGFSGGIGFINDCPGFNAGFFLDAAVCPNGPMLAHANSTVTDGMRYERYWSTNQTPGNTNNVMGFGRMLRLNQLPFDVQQDLFNSIDAADVRTEIMAETPLQVVRLHITKLRIGGNSYPPPNAYVDIWGEGNILLNPKDPGLKFMAGWTAKQIKTLLDRGTPIRWAVEINGGVTITSDMMPPNMIVDIGYQTVEELSEFASSHTRD